MFSCIHATGFRRRYRQGTPTTEPNVVSIEEVATMTGGTGRFGGTTGAFTIHRVLKQATGVSSGSFDGLINLGH